MENVETELTTESTVINEDEEFYENLEAPMFVDFTAPDFSYPGDGSWFCLKIGCDQNHEQIDPEALNKSFMLRVLAARSPNVRLHKSLKHRDRLNAKCPHSAPAKQPRSRLVRLSTATEIPEKNANSKLKDHPISNLKSTPNQTKKMILPTIGEKSTTSTPKGQNMSSKNEPASEGKNRSAFFSAKPLFSPAPKKEIKEVCEKLRKLNLNNPKKRRSVPSRYLSQVTKGAMRSNKSKVNDTKLKEETEIGPKKITSWPLRKTKQQVLEGNESKVNDSNLKEETEIGPKKITSWPLRKTKQQVLEGNESKVNDSNLKEETEIGPKNITSWPSRKTKQALEGNEQNLGSDMISRERVLEVRQKKESLRPRRKLSRLVLNENIECDSKSVEENGGIGKEFDLKSETKEVVSANATSGSVLKENVECSSASGVENRGIRKEHDLKSETKEAVNTNATSREQKLIMGPKRKSSRPLWKSNQAVWKKNIENGTDNEGDSKKEVLRSKITGNLGIGVEKDGLRTLENYEACDENKENDTQNGTKRIEVGKKMAAEKKKCLLVRASENVPLQQVLKVQKKPSQVNPDQGIKNKRTTNPKPFRLRTDERGILKEANLEKKRIVHSEPLKEESKNIPRKDNGTVRCKGRVVPSKFQCLNKGPTSVATKRRNALPKR